MKDHWRARPTQFFVVYLSRTWKFSTGPICRPVSLITADKPRAIGLSSLARSRPVAGWWLCYGPGKKMAVALRNVSEKYDSEKDPAGGEMEAFDELGKPMIPKNDE